MDVIICDLPAIKIACNIFIERAFGEFEEDHIEIDSETKTCRLYCNKRIDKAKLERNLEEYCLVGQHARIGCKDDLPEGVKCSGLVVTFKPDKSDSYSPPPAVKANPTVIPRRTPTCYTDLVTAEIVSTPGKIAFLQRFSTLFDRIRQSHGKIEIDASWRKITVNASQQDIDELVNKHISLNEKLNPLPPIYWTVAVKHFASIRDLFEYTLASVPTLSNLQVILCQSREGGSQCITLVAASERFVRDAVPLLEGLFASRDVELEDIHETLMCSEEWEEALDSWSKKYRVSFDPQSQSVLKIAGVKEDLEPCYKEVSRMLDSGATVELIVEFQNSKDIDIVWQKLGLENSEYKDLLSSDEQRHIVTIAGRAKDARTMEQKIVACRDSLAHIDIKDLNSPGLATFLASPSGQEFLLRYTLEANGRPRHCRVFVFDKASTKRRSARRKVSDKPMGVISEVKCGSKVTIAVVQGNLLTVQASGAVLIPLTKFGARHADCSSELWSRFLGIDKRACETALSGLKPTNGRATFTEVNSQHLSYSHICFVCTSTPWSKEQEALKDLAKVVGRCLLSMDRNAVSTVSVAVASWQELVYPEASVAKAIKTACEQYSGNSALKLYLPVDNSHTAHVVCRSLGIEELSLAALGKTASDANLKRMLDIGEVDSSAAAAGGVKKSGPAAVSSTFVSYAFANVTLSLHKGTLRDFKASALVCTVASKDKTLLEVGAVGASFYEVGGDALDQAYLASGVRLSRVASVPKVAGFQCDRIIFLSIRKWDESKTQKYLRVGFEACMAEAEKYNCSTIAFPTIGSGHLHYPPNEVAAILWDVCWAKQPGSVVKHVHIVAHDDGVWQTFKREFCRMGQPASQHFSDSGGDKDNGYSRSHGRFARKYGRLDKAKAHVAPAADSDQGPSSGSGPVIRIVAADQRTADRVETEVRDRLDELFISATVTEPVIKVLQLYDTVELKSRAGNAEEVAVDIDKTKGTVTIRGHKDVVMAAQPRVIAFLKDLTTTPLYKTIMSGERGLLDVLADRDVPYPNSWSTNPGRRPADVSSSFVRRSPCLPGSAEFMAVDQLVQATWKQEFVGVGADAVDLTHKSITVTKVERIENGELFKKYTECRRSLCKHLRDGVTFPSVKDSDGGLDVETSAVETSALDWWDRDSHVKHYPLPLINEVLLFHGTKPDVYEGIVHDGFDFRLNQRSMFGTGAYFAESSTKADQYADARGTRQLTGDKYMIIARVILGHPYVCTNPQPFCRPPCVEPNCDQLDKCMTAHKKSHSVIGVNRNDGRRLLFREFVLYDSTQCYPLYLVTYNRV